MLNKLGTKKLKASINEKEEVIKKLRLENAYFKVKKYGTVIGLMFLVLFIGKLVYLVLWSLCKLESVGAEEGELPSIYETVLITSITALAGILLSMYLGKLVSPNLKVSGK